MYTIHIIYLWIFELYNIFQLSRLKRSWFLNSKNQYIAFNEEEGKTLNLKENFYYIILKVSFGT